MLTQDTDATRQPWRLIICVDYGTTFTGVAWILTDPPKQPTAADIKIVQNWTQGGVTENQYKVPSEYTYSRNTGARWGFNIADSAYILKWTKLQLEVPSRASALRSMKRLLQEADKLDIDPGNGEAEKSIPGHITRTASEIVTEYLEEVMKQVQQDVERAFNGDRIAFEQLLEQVPIDLIITHPAKWDSRGKNITFRAVNSAFNQAFAELNFLRGCVRLATEPEACAQYTLQVARAKALQASQANVRTRADGMKHPWHQLSIGECVIIVDAGGGTVDAVAYLIQALTPEFKIDRITDPETRPWGATLVDSYFLDTFLPQRLGHGNYRKLLSMGQERDFHGSGGHTVHKIGEQYVLKKFQALKHEFSGEPCDEMVLGLPEELKFRDNPSRGIRRGQLLISCQDMEEMFRGCIKGIEDLIDRQLRVISEKRRKVRTIFLSGGFSQNGYLLKRVQSSAGDYQVIQAENPSIAVAGGGVLLGLGLECKIPPLAVECPYSLGVKASTDFAPYDHAEAQEYRDVLDGKMRARNHIDWFAFKGDLIEHDSAETKTVNLIRKFVQDGSRVGRVIIVCSKAKDPQMPDANDEPPSEVPLDFDLDTKIPSDDLPRLLQTITHPKTGKTYQQLALQLDVTIRQKNAEIQLVCGKTVGLTRVVGAEGYPLGHLPIEFPAQESHAESC
ncbi:hypothetical protein QBC43DRAFT_375362 [Cladorrhinum sp. PSN259]|nr:hypothetical protein QBC43DRAFT_375362 [Cladorrhinum sp. PSN259]